MCLLCLSTIGHTRLPSKEAGFRPVFKTEYFYSLNNQKFEALMCEGAENRKFLSKGATCSNNSALTFFILAQDLRLTKVFSDDGLL